MLALRDPAMTLIGGVAGLAHRIGYRKGEIWLSDLWNDRGQVASLRGTLLIFAPAAGEVSTVAPLIEKLRLRHPELPVITCVTTKSGMEAAVKQGLRCVRLPCDNPKLSDRVCRELSPCGLVIVQVCHPRGMPVSLVRAVSGSGRSVAVINGYLPDRDISSASGWIGKSLRAVYSRIALFCMQTEDDASRLAELGVERSRIEVMGNMKFDAALSSISRDSSESLARQLGWSEAVPVVVAGSTHDGEETAVLQAFKKAWLRIPGAKLVIAPRAVARAEQIVKLAESMGFSASLRTRISGDPSVIVLDTHGELRHLYALARVAFVGGTLVPIGGHNVIEPAVLGKPVIFGPHVQHTSGAAEMLARDGGAIQVLNEEDLARVFETLLSDDDLRISMGEKARRSVESCAGALERCLEQVEQTMLTKEDKAGNE